MSPDAPKHARLIVGAFDFERSFWGAILLNPAGNVVHRWYMSGEIEALTDKPDFNKTLYGVAFFPDGSAIYTLQELGGGLVKIDACSRIVWTKKGKFHHAISPVENHSAFWTFGGTDWQLHPKLILIDTANGATIREIDMAGVEKANVGLSLFDLQREANVRNATHPNDVDPLPTAWASAYPRFEAGDLLLSYHTTNLIFVLDANSLKIKWWYVGAGDGAHDPDWHKDGRITLFNNNWRAERRGGELVSTIVSVDPERNSHRTLIDGKLFEFYSSFNGNHEITADGSALITSSTQGRVFEVDLASGRRTFEFVNAYDWDSDQTLHLAESFIIDDAKLKRWTAKSCTAKSVQKGDTQ
jgi:DNA-binding beta-propeller fold protein YncE